MTCIIVSSEHDMEEAIKYTINLTHNIKGRKRLGFSFPSDRLSHIFLKNLALGFVEEGLSIRNNLELNIYLPDKEIGLRTDDEDDDILDDDLEWDYDSLFDDEDGE